MPVGRYTYRYGFWVPSLSVVARARLDNQGTAFQLGWLMCT